MATTKYTPFLKLKANEVGAFANLADEVSDNIVPFFDLPMKKALTAATFRTMVDKSARKMEKNLGNDRPFFLDNFDIPDAITVGGKPNYSYVAAAFSKLTFIPVIGLNRPPAPPAVSRTAPARPGVPAGCVAPPAAPRRSAPGGSRPRCREPEERKDRRRRDRVPWPAP